MSMFFPLCVVLSYILHSAHSVNVKIYPDICKEKVFPKLVEGYRFVHDDVPVIPQLSVKDAELEEGEKGNSEASDAAGMKEDPKSMPLLSGPVLTPGRQRVPEYFRTAFHTLGQTHHIKRPQSVPENCQRDPDFISVGAVKRFTTRKPRYPVVIEYGCGRQAGREYKYVTGTTEAKCDHKGWWTLPALLCAPVGCYLEHWGRAEYAGNVSITVSGRTCQPWTADTPHVRNKFCRSTSLYYVDGSVSAAGNSCRDPDGTGKPWCYTTDPMKRWEICNIQECRREIKLEKD
ncbi:uncharacterized protein LOC125381604 [Haliotis rufescens]|uniref:uncharacterized protein LOC125381604 n=1 Tax=Haliotis rufescens TaxID=6454 RepID=UPI00201EAC0A|nr:uncharacterized protein LOC125381604 [Haliotis rufescens]